MNITHYFLLISFLILSGISSDAQELLFDIQTINIEDGLPNRNVFDVVQDKDGFMWVSTSGQISRYDGYQFKTYSARDLNITDGSGCSLAVDKNNNIWYAKDGVDHFSGVINTKNDSIYSLEAITNGLFTSKEIVSLNRSELNPSEWFIINDKGAVYHYKNGFEKIYQIPETITSNARCEQHSMDSYLIINAQKISKIISGKNVETIQWIDTLKQMIRPYRIIRQYPSIILEIFSPEPEIKYWEFKAQQFVPYAPKNYSPSKVKGLLQIQTEPIIFTTTENLVIQNKTTEIIYKFENLRKTHFDFKLLGYRASFTDNQHILWVSTNNGLLKIIKKENPFTIFQPNNGIRGIYQEGDSLWIGGGYSGNLLYRLDNGEKKPFINRPFTASGFSRGNEGHLWVGTTSAHLLEYIPEKEQPVIHNSPLENHILYLPFINSVTKKLWIGTNNGLAFLDSITQEIIASPLLTSSTNVEVRSFHQNEKGIWIVTSKGLFLMDSFTEKILKHYSITDGFPAENFTHLYEDKDKIFWLSTKSGGLIRWNRKTHTIRQFKQEDGLSNNTIYAVYEDAYNHLWLPSDYGLMSFDKNTFLTQVYLPQNGIAQEEFNTFSHFRAADSTLYFGGLNGVTKFHSKDLRKQAGNSLPLYLTKIRSLNDEAEEYQDITANFQKNNRILLNPNHKILALELSLLDYSASVVNQYAYKISGYQDQWIYTKENKVSIINLPYGKYQLHLKGRGSSGNWSQPISIPLEVKTPFYLQLRFIFSMIILTALSIIAIIKRQEIQFEKDKIRLESEVKKRTQTIREQAKKLKALDKAKTRFFSNITHEFRTPLTLIIGPLEQYLKKKNVQEANNHLSGVLKNARHLLTLINQLLDLSKLENGDMKIGIMQGELVQYTQDLVHRFQPLLDKKGIRIGFLANSKTWDTYFDKDKWGKIIYNLLSNAIKFTPKGGAVQLSLLKAQFKNRDWIHLEIKDSGIGISKSQLNQIFNRFYQVDNSTTRHQAGTGIGLALVKELVEIQGGEIWVSSVVNKGTCFEIRIPVLEKTDLAQSPPIFSSIIPIPEQGAIETILSPKKHSKESQLEILIIEDNLEMQQFIQSCLDPKKYLVKTANDGAAGIQKAIDLIPDLIISDVMMPKKDGFEVVRNIKENINTSHIPIILLTAKAALDSKLEGLKRGADAYLTKPFSPDELTIRIEKLIELRQQLQFRYTHRKEQQPLLSLTTEQVKKEDKFIIDLHTYITKNLEIPKLNGDTIGKEFGMSRMQLHRKLKGLINQSTSEYVRSIRLETAHQLILAKKLGSGINIMLFKKKVVF